MFKDKDPKKYVILGTLLIIILLGLIIFFGMRAQAADDKFLPIKEIKTPGGISVWIVEDHTLPVFSLKFMFRDSGTALDPEDMQGLARMLSNTMDEGAGGMDSQAFQKALNDNSITLTFNAGRDGFGGELKTLTRNSQKAFDLLALSLTAPRFDAEAVTRMKDGNLTRIKSSMSEPDWMAARLINDSAFSGHPYAKNSGGTLSGLGRITPADLRKFKDSYLTQDRLLIAAAGDINAETLGPAVDKIFASLPKTAQAGTIKDVQIVNQGNVYLYEQSIPQTMIEVMIPTFDNTDKDFYALQVLNYIYGGAGFGSRLMDEAREKRGLTYGIYSSLQDYRHTDTMNISTSTKTESTAEMLEIIKQEMLRLQNEKVSEKELTDAKSYITGSMPLALTSTDDIADIVLGLRMDDRPIDYLDQFTGKIRAVTADDIQRVAKRVLIPDNMVTALVGKPANITKVNLVKELPNVQ